MGGWPARPGRAAGAREAVAGPERPAGAERERTATDAQVVARSVDVPADFAELFDRHAPAIHRYLARRAGQQIADDLVASTFLVAFERRGSYDVTRADARPWLYGIASNLLGRHRRDEERRLRAYGRAGADTLAEDGIERALERVDAQASKRAVAAAMAELSAEDRDVLLLFAWAAFSYAEIAEAVGVPVGTVRSRLNRARRRLRATLGAGDPRPIEEGHHA